MILNNDSIVDMFDGDVRSFRDDTGVGADTASVSCTKSDESSLSPSSSPGVLDFPGSANNTDQEDSVVDTLATVAEDTAFVRAPVRSIDGHGDGTGVDSIGKSIAAACA